MSRGPGVRGGLLWVGVALLGACAEIPPAPAPVPVVRASPQDERVSRAIARHRQLAEQHRQAGDLAAAAAQWQILTTLAPGDATFRQELAATRAVMDQRARENLAAGTAALKAGDADRAADAMLKVLALEPGNAEAAQALRDIERKRMARTQASRAARAGGTSVAANNGASRPAAAQGADVAYAYSLEQPLEMFKAGDTEGGLRELRQFVAANPNDRSARNRIGAAVYDRGKELEAQGQREQALAMYQEAVALRGSAAPGWSSRIQALKKALGK